MIARNVMAQLHVVIPTQIPAKQFRLPQRQRANGGGEHMHGNIHVDVGSSEYWEHKVGGPPPKSRMWMAQSTHGK